MLDKGIKLSRAGKPHEAAALLEQAASDYPDFGPLLWYLGGIYQYELKQHERALPFLQKASELNPKSKKASLGVFHSLWDLDRKVEALEEIKRFQVLTNWSCQDYLDIMDEIKEKWLTEKPAKKTKTGRREKKA